MEKDYSDLKDMIFNGFNIKTIKCNNYKISFRTLTYHEAQKVFKEENNFNLVLSILSKILLSINDVEFNDVEKVKKVLINSSSILISNLYKIYKQIVDDITGCVEDFHTFVETQESRVKWELFKQGYKIDQPLSPIQESWIYWNTQQDKKEKYDYQFNLVKYAVSKITHAVVNPKTYVQSLRQESNKQQYPTDEKKDLSTDIFEKIKEAQKDNDKEKANSVWNQAINSDDDHDKIVKKQEIIRFKNAIRKIKNSSVIKSPKVRRKIKVEDSHSVVLDHKEIKQNPYVINGKNYTHLMRSKAFATISLEEKERILFEVVNEKEEPEDNLKVNLTEPMEIVDRKTSKRGITLRQLMEEKGMSPQDLNKANLEDLYKEAKGDKTYE